MGSSNTFSRAMKHLKAPKPSGLFESVPTNHTQGIYQTEPDTIVTTNPDIDIPDFDQDGDGSNTYIGQDTSGLFMSDGTIRVIEPPGNTSAILGPMASMWYAWGNFSTFGYIRQSDRKMVNLGRITGKLSDWDGVSDFTSYNNDFTIDQAVWFRDTPKYGGISNDPAEANYRAFYPGPPSNTPDQYGRYYCTITGTPKQGTTGQKGPKTGPEGAGFPWGIIGDIFKALKNFGQSLGAPPDMYGGAGALSSNHPDMKGFVEALESLALNGLPAANYATDIALSILNNEPIVKDQADIPQFVIDALANGIPPSMISGGAMKVTDTPINYSDDNFYVDDNGKVHAHTPETLQKYPNNTGQVGYPQAYGGLDNPLAAAGQAQVQFVYPSDGSEPYMQYTDHAYHNINSTDPGEVPDPIKKGLSYLTHVVAGHGNKDEVQPGTKGQYNTGTLDSTTPNTGGMEGYPPNIRGDVVTNVKVPVEQLPQSIKDQIGKVFEHPNVYSDHPINQTKTESFKPLPRLPRRTNKVSNLNESHTLDVIKNIKKPVVIEEKKEKVKRRPRVIGSEPRTLNTSLMKQAEVPASFKKPEERMWGKYEREQNARASQDRKNVVLDHLGNADQAWEYLLDRNAGKRSFAGYFEKDGTPRTIFTDGKVKTVTREEKVGTDTLIFFTDEEGKKGSILQSEYNELQDQAHTQQMFAEYEATVAAAKEEENDFDKIANKLELKAERNPTNDKIQSMLSSYRALSHLRKEDKKQEAHFTSWKSTIDGKITSNFQSWVDSVGQETADAVAVTEAMTSGDMFVRTQLEPTGEEIRVTVPSDSFRYNQSDAVTTTGGVVKFGEVAPHNYDSQYWWRQTASTNYITTTDVPGEQTVTHVTFDVDLGTGIDAPLPNHPLKVEYQMIYRDSNGNAYSAGSGTLGNITAGGKTSFELPQYHEYFEISFDLTVDGTWMRSYEQDYQRRMFVGTTLAGATLTHDDTVDNIGPVAMILDVLRHPGPFDDDADTTMHVLLFNGFSSRISGLPGGTSGAIGSDREYLYNLIRSQYAHLKDRYALTYTINSMGLTRVAPITVWVPLDSPEAVSFMRTAPEMQGLTPAERLKKLKEMLEAGNEYLIKMLGYQGSTATPDGYNTEVALDTIPYEEPSPGPGGYKPPGSYDPNKFYDLKTDPSQLPSPNLPSTGPGRSSVPDGTEVAASYPKMDPLDKLLKDIDDADKKLKNQPPGTRPGKGRGMGDRWDFNKFVKGKNNTVVAHHEPKGKYLADSKTFKKKSFSNWYSSMESDISDKVIEETKRLIEGMTSGGLFQATLPAMGDYALDTISDLSINSADNLQPYQDYGDPDYAITVQDNRLGAIDASEYDTLKFTISGSFNTRTVDGSSLTDTIWVGAFINGTYGGNYLAQGLGAGTHTIPIPARFQKPGMRFSFIKMYAIQGVSSSTSVTNIEFQRRSPKTIFVSLDSPEAVNFIRTAPMMQGLTPQERLDRLKKMLESGNKYLLQQLGYMGSTATPGPDEVAQALPYTDEDDAFDNPYYDDPFKDPGDLDDSDDESTWDYAKEKGDTEVAGTNWDLYNWMNKTYGLPAAEWKKNNPTKPDSSNPHLPAGSYVPRA